MSIASGTGTVLPISDAASGKVSHVASERSKTTSSFSNDGDEAEDKIKAPVGREILSAKQRVRVPIIVQLVGSCLIFQQKIYSGRGGSGNAHKLVADETVYQRVLLHEQGILHAYKEERMERAARYVISALFRSNIYSSVSHYPM
jgi:hypothetical protein